MSLPLRPITLTAHDALLVIDMQNDFASPTGALSVRGGEEIVLGINTLAARFPHVILTQDWHPAAHISFASTHNLKPFADTIRAPYGTQTLWPDHCLQGSSGAALHPALNIPHTELILRKGFRKDIDSYSAFTENDRTTPTGLTGYLRERGLTRLFFTGLAYDFCVGYSAIDAVQHGFTAIVLEDLTRAVALPTTVETTNNRFADLNIQRIRTSELTL